MVRERGARERKEKKGRRGERDVIGEESGRKVRIGERKNKRREGGEDWKEEMGRGEGNRRRGEKGRSGVCSCWVLVKGEIPLRYITGNFGEERGGWGRQRGEFKPAHLLSHSLGRARTPSTSMSAVR